MHTLIRVAVAFELWFFASVALGVVVGVLLHFLPGGPRE